MQILLILASLLSVVALMVSIAWLHMVLEMRAVASRNESPLPISDYRPMLRLLAEQDFRLVADNPLLLKKLQRDRRRVFRSYLTSLRSDYSVLLQGIRQAMVDSGYDRPDLASALTRHQFNFAAAMLRIEVRLMLHTLGLGAVDVTGLVQSIEALRSQVNVFSAGIESSAA